VRAFHPRIVAVLAAAHIIGIALAALVLLPMFEFLGTAASSHGSQTGLGIDTDPWRHYLLAELAPFALGGPISSILPGGGHAGIQGFVGCAVLALASVAVFSLPLSKPRVRGPVIALALFALYAVLKRYGNPLVQWSGMLPAAQLVIFPKYIEAVLDPSIAILAGFGMAYIREPERRSSWSLFLGFATVLGALTVAYVSVRGDVPSSGEGHFAAYTLLALAALTLTALTVLLAWKKRVGAAIATCALIAIVSVEPIFGYIVPNIWDAPPINWNPYGGAPYLSFLAKAVDRNQQRVFANGYDLFPNWAGAYGFADPRELNALYPSGYFEFLKALLARGGAVFPFEFMGSEIEHLDDPLVRRWIQLSSIRYIVSPREESAPGFVCVFKSPYANVYRVDFALPRMRLLHRATPVTSREAALATLRAPDFDVSTNVVVEGMATVRPPGGPEHVQVVTNKSDRIEVNVTAVSDAVLMQSDTYYPGWIARLDGRETPILRADGIFRGIAIPAGRHHLTILYRSSAVRAGILVSIIALLAICALYCWPAIVLTLSVIGRAGTAAARRARSRPTGRRS
jgi:hypothetical protein